MKELTGEGLVVTATESDGVEREIAHGPCFPLFVAPHAAGFRPLTRKIKSWKVEAVPECVGAQFPWASAAAQWPKFCKYLEALGIGSCPWTADQATPRPQGLSCRQFTRGPHSGENSQDEWSSILTLWLRSAEVLNGCQDEVCERFWVLNHREGLSVLLR